MTDLPPGGYKSVGNIVFSGTFNGTYLHIISFYLYKLLILNDFYTTPGGERGIRTLDTRLTYTPLAGERLQPLGHLSDI